MCDDYEDADMIDVVCPECNKIESVPDVEEKKPFWCTSHDEHVKMEEL